MTQEELATFLEPSAALGVAWLFGLICGWVVMMVRSAYRRRRAG